MVCVVLVEYLCLFVERAEEDGYGGNGTIKMLVSSLFHSLSLSLTLYPLLIITTDKLLTILLLL